MSSIQIWFVILIATILLVCAFVGWVYLTRWQLVAAIGNWAQRVGQVLPKLEEFSEACANRPGTDSPFLELADIVNTHAAGLDESSTLLGHVPRLLARANVLNGFLNVPVIQNLFWLDPIDTDALRATGTVLTEARKEALTEVRAELANGLPDLRDRLSDLPVQVSALAIGVLSLVGIVWMSGYYGILGVPFMPLLTDFEDAALVGFSAGLTPLLAFTAMAALTLRRVGRIRDMAIRIESPANGIADALYAVRELRRSKFWATRAVFSLLIVFACSLTAAATAHLRNEYGVVVVDEPGLSQMRILGAIGDYVVMSDLDVNRVVTMPKGRLDCFQTADSPHPVCEPQKSTASGGNSSQIAVEIAAILAQVRQREDWQSFVRQHAQCWVSAPESVDPLLSPVFVDNSPELFDVPYYKSHPAYWPFEHTCNGEQLKNTSQDRIHQCALQGIRSNLSSWAARAVTARPGTASLHIFGFASGTALPPENIGLSKARSEFVADSLIREMPELSGCRAEGSPGAECPIAIRTYGLGEMPQFLWAGMQGDATKRVALIAACDQYVH